MADDFNNIAGLRQLRDRLAKMEVNMQRKIPRRAVASAASVVKKEAKRIVKSQGLVRTGTLHKNIALKRERQSPVGETRYNVGVRHGRALGRKATKKLVRSSNGRIVSKYQNDPFYWRFIEFGHRTVPRRKAKQSNFMRARDSISYRRKHPTGKVPAKPFIGPSLKNKQREAAQKMREVLERLIIKNGG